MKAWKKENWFIVLIAGILLLVISLPHERRPENISKKPEDYEYERMGYQEDDYIRITEEKLEKMLGKVIGVGRVSVMITLSSSSENGYESPYVKQERIPEIEGVFVVAEGGGDAVIQKKITEVVQALFPVETHKIRVMKHN